MPKLSIAIPASVVADVPHLREKTAKIGLIGRAAAIFRVTNIVVYRDDLKSDQRREMNLITTLLSYLETPQYLRKQLFKLDPILQYAGILPPLRTPHHPLNRESKKLRVGEYRDGITQSETGDGTQIDIGVEKLALVKNVYLETGKRLTIKIIGVNQNIEAELADHAQMREYWGYNVTMERHSLRRFLETRAHDLRIGTSRYGTPYASVADKIRDRWKRSGSALVIFGAPTHGLYDIAKHEGFPLESILDFMVNTIPNQGTETVRTEESLIATLNVFNTCFAF